MSLSFSEFLSLRNELEAHLPSGLKTKAKANIDAIRTYVELGESGQDPTQTDRLKASKFTGMGGLKYLFEETNEEWYPLHEELINLLPTAEYETLRGSILNAHYTSPEIVKCLWMMARTMGFNGGKVLSPSFGMGYFKLFNPYDDLYDQCEWTAIELDKVTAGLARIIHPDALFYNSGFESVALPENHYDLVIDNFPFGDYKLSDKLYPEFGHLHIHNFFFAKSMKLLRPGGLLIAITSSGTLGSEINYGFRCHLKSQANLVAAYRLPSNAFKTFNTEVTTDALVFQKLDPENDILPDEEFDWTELKDTYMYSYHSRKYLTAPSYYIRYDNHHLGYMQEDKLWPGRLACVAAPDQNTFDLLSQLALKLPRIYLPNQRHGNSRGSAGGTDDSVITVIPEHLQHIPNYSFFEHEGRLYQRLERSIHLVEGASLDRIRRMTHLARLLEEVLEAQKSPDDIHLFEIQADLRHTYDEFVELYGRLRSKANWDAFAQDGRIYLLQSLEVEVRQEGSRKVDYKQADIFFKRTARPNITPNISNAKDAMMVCLNQLGKFDAAHTARLLGVSVEDLIDELETEDCIFYNPATETHETADEYLSGNVVIKLTIARQHVTQRQSLQRNIDALEKVQPLFLLPPASPDVKAEVAIALGGEEKCDLDPGAVIEARLGSPWISPEVIQEFVAFLIECYPTRVKVRHAIGNNNWAVILSDYERFNTKNSSVYGTPDFTATELIECCLNSKEIAVYDNIELPDGTKKRVKNAQKSQTAQAKAKQIKEVFRTWLWQDRQRALALTIEYNRRFNQTIERKYDGSHLTFPGMAPGFTLRRTQKNGIWQCICNPSTLIAHTVGAGKSALSVAAVMEMKRLGIVAKPMIVVLNATLPQFEAEFRRLYPAAKLLVPNTSDFSKHNRRRLIATVATWDWDCILIPASQFTTIQLNRETQLQYLAIEQQAVNDDLAAFGRDRKSFVTKALERKKKGIDKKINDLRNAKIEEGVVSWEQLGIDCLVVDEFHLRFKKPGISTKMNGIAGIDTSQSQRGLDMFMKVHQILGDAYLLESSKDFSGSDEEILQQKPSQKPGRVIFMTGTPITNSIGELYTIQRYLQLTTLRDAGIAGFDAWALNFGEVVTAPEISPTGKYQVKSRFSRFTNLPKLIGMYRLIASVVSQSDLRKPMNWAEISKDMTDEQRIEAEKLFIQIPDHTINNVASEPSPDQRAYMQKLLERSEKIKAGEVDPKDDNMLVVTGDGRKSCIDMRLVSRHAANWLDSKINKCAVNVFKIWKSTEDLKLTQAIFCDFSTPKDGKAFDVYTYLRDLLVDMGIPREQIKFAHEYATPEAKLKFYDEFNRGERRVFITSTEKGATGTNIQRRLVAVHHIDAPWRPADIEQRDGRILRVHNLCPHVFLFRYVTEGTSDLCGFDSFLWQGLETKARYIEQIMNASSGQHTVEDVGGTALTYAELKALASGDPRIVRKAVVDQQVQELSLVLKGLEAQLTQCNISVGSLPKTIDRYTDQLARYESDFELVSAWNNHEAVVKYSKEELDELKAIAKANAVDKSQDQPQDQDETEAADNAEDNAEGGGEDESEIVDGVEVVKVSSGKGKKDTRVQYKPLFYPITIYQGADEPVITTDVREAGELILEEVNSIQDGRITGRHQIGYIPILCDVESRKEDGFKIIAEFRPANNYTVLYVSRQSDYQISLTSNGVQNIRAMFSVGHKIQDALHSLRQTLNQSKGKFKNLAPQIETLEADVRKYRAELEPLIQEQIELDALLNISVGEVQVSGVDTNGNSGASSNDDDDEASGIAAFFGGSSELAPYMGIEPEITEGLLEKVESIGDDWVSELYHKTVRPMLDQIFGQVDSQDSQDDNQVDAQIGTNDLSVVTNLENLLKLEIAEPVVGESSIGEPSIGEPFIGESPVTEVPATEVVIAEGVETEADITPGEAPKEAPSEIPASAVVNAVDAVDNSDTVSDSTPSNEEDSWASQFNDLIPAVARKKKTGSEEQFDLFSF